MITSSADGTLRSGFQRPGRSAVFNLEKEMNLSEFFILTRPNYIGADIGAVGGKRRNANRRGSHKFGEPGTHSRKKLPKPIKMLVYTRKVS